jgi:hypothetical protein
MTPENLPCLTVAAEQLGPIWTPLRSEPQRCLALPAPQAPSTITKMAA